MRRALIISAGLHLALLLWVLIGLPDFGEELAEESAIAVGIVVDGDAEPETPPAPEVAEAAPLPERRAASRPPPAQPDPVVEDLPEPELSQAAPPAPSPPAEVPAEPPAEPKPAEIPAPVPEPETAIADSKPAVVPRARPTAPPPRQVAEAAPEAPARPQLRPPAPQAATPPPAPRPPPPPVQQAEQPPDDDRFDALLRSVENLNRRIRADTQRDGTGDRDGEPVQVADAGVDVQAIAARQNAIAASARQQMEACWRVPAGLQGVASMANFEVNVIFRRDATAQSVEIADNDRLSRDPLFRVVAESAQRAAWSCQLSLPPEMFDLWRTMTFVFDPSRAVAG